jgi:hypothetical protein
MHVAIGVYPLEDRFVSCGVSSGIAFRISDLIIFGLNIYLVLVICFLVL